MSAVVTIPLTLCLRSSDLVRYILVSSRIGSPIGFAFTRCFWSRIEGLTGLVDTVDDQAEVPGPERHVPRADLLTLERIEPTESGVGDPGECPER